MGDKANNYDIITPFFFLGKRQKDMCHKINLFIKIFPLLLLLLGVAKLLLRVKLGFDTGNLSVHFQEIADFIEVESEFHKCREHWVQRFFLFLPPFVYYYFGSES